METILQSFFPPVPTPPVAGAEAVAGSVESAIEATAALPTPNWPIPNGYLPFASQFTQLQQGVGVVELEAVGQLELTGKDRQKFLHNLTTNHILQLPVGCGCEAFLLNAKGKIVSYVHLFAFPEMHVVEYESSQADELWKHLDKYLLRAQVQLHQRGADYFQCHFLGSQVQTYWETVFTKTGQEVPLPTERLTATILTLAGHACSLRRRDRSRWPGYDLFIPKAGTAAVLQVLADCTLTASLQPTTIQSALLEPLRVEAGLPRWGHDVLPDNLPQEIDRNQQAIHFEKGCYIGQETVARIDAVGHVNRIFRGLRLQHQVVPPGGASVWLDDKLVGQIGSAAWSFAEHRPIALAVVRTQAAVPGTEVQIRLEDDTLPATVAALPFG